MKKLILCKLFIYTVLCTSTLFAQDSLSVIGKFIQGHPWTMDFGISSNLTLSTFQGTAISLSKFISDYQKYRFGISTDLSENSGDQTGKQYASDTLSGFTSGDNKTTNYSVRLTAQYITYATPAGHTSIYFGIGPLAGISWYKSTSNSTSNSIDSYQSQYSYTNSETRYFLGMLGSCGVEWFFSEHISLHAEYGLSMQYTWGTTESNSSIKYGYVNSNTYSSKSNSSGSSSGWSLYGQRVLFGLSVNY